MPLQSERNALDLFDPQALLERMREAEQSLHFVARIRPFELIYQLWPGEQVRVLWGRSNLPATVVLVLAAPAHQHPPGRGWPPGPIPHTIFDEPCLDFVNSRFTDYRGSGGEFDRLELADWRRWFLNRWNFQAPVRASAETIRQLKRVRSLLRELMSTQGPIGNHAIRRLNGMLAGSPSKWHLELLPAKQSQARLAMGLRPTDPGWDSVIAEVVVSFARLATSEGLARVKRCENPDCTFLFFDDSPNRTRRWCEAANCGNLVNARRFRASKMTSPVRVRSAREIAARHA